MNGYFATPAASKSACRWFSPPPGHHAYIITKNRCILVAIADVIPIPAIGRGVPLDAADERIWPHWAAVALARVLDGGFGFALTRIARPSG
jgi:hypothetical protein